MNDDDALGPSIFDGYRMGDAYDEMFSASGDARLHCQMLHRRLSELQQGELQQRQQAIDRAFFNQGITFTVYGDEAGTENIFPFDLLPRVIAAQEWVQIERGLRQRITALNLFIQDVYHDGRILRDKVVPAELVYSCKHYRRQMRGVNVPRGTAADSPIDHALSARKGVCQDFSHIMLAIVRTLGIPCRYVSGYLYHERDASLRSDPDASHAWVEVLLPELGWVGFDPTNNMLVGDRHIRVAIGREYSDVPPSRGVHKGTSGGALTVAVAVEQLDALPDEDDLVPPPGAYAMVDRRPVKTAG
jgi:hypothetical protein